MTRKTIGVVFGRLLHGLAIASLVASRTIAAMVPVGAADDKAVGADWADIRGELESPNPHPAMNADLADLVRGTDFAIDWQETVRMTYRIVTQDEVRWLDELWLDMLTTNGNATLLAEFLALRGGIEPNDAAVENGESYVDRWLWQVKAGDCDGAAG